MRSENFPGMIDVSYKISVLLNTFKVLILYFSESRKKLEDRNFWLTLVLQAQTTLTVWVINQREE